MRSTRLFGVLAAITMIVAILAGTASAAKPAPQPTYCSTSVFKQVAPIPGAIYTRGSSIILNGPLCVPSNTVSVQCTITDVNDTSGTPNPNAQYAGPALHTSTGYTCTKYYNPGITPGVEDRGHHTVTFTAVVTDSNGQTQAATASTYYTVY